MALWQLEDAFALAGLGIVPGSRQCAALSDTVDTFNRDQVILNDVYHSVMADPQPVIIAAVEGIRRVWVLS